MSDRDHYHQNYHRNSNNTNTSNNTNRDSPSSRRASASSTSYNGGGGGHSGVGHSGGGQVKPTMPAATMRNSSPTSAVAGLSEDLAHLNLPAEVSVGSTVQCTLAGQSNRIFKGEVVAFDPTVKAIILKSSSSCNRSSLNDVHILNLSQMKELKILNENRDPVADPPSLNLPRLQNRLREQVDRKKRLVMAFKAGISPEGQKLFQAIGKTIDEIVWKDENIVVMREVTITPPYKPENVKGNSDSKALKHVKKIVEKHLNDQFLLLKQQQEAAVGVRGGSDIVVVHNNNNNNKSETSTPSTTINPSPALGGTSSPAGAPQQQQHHQSATRTGSTGRYEDGKSGGGGGRPPRQTGGGARSSTQKRDYDQSKTISSRSFTATARSRR